MKDSLVKCRKSGLVNVLTGQLLIAHPIVDEKEFSKTIIFVESDDKSETSGFILNRPLNFMLKMLGPQFKNLPISNTPVYDGGEIDKNMVMITAWLANSEKKTLEIYYSLNGNEAIELLEMHKNIQFRAYLGHCLFSHRIHNDIENGLWVVGSPKNLFGADEHGEILWRSLLLKENPNALLHTF